MGLFDGLRAKKEEKERVRQEMQEAALTLYASGQDGDRIPEILGKVFDIMPEEVVEDGEKLFVVSIQDGSCIRFSVTANTQENIVQSNGMANYFSQSPLENENVKNAPMAHFLHSVFGFQSTEFS